MTAFSPVQQHAYDLLLKRGVERPDWAEIYDVIHDELGGPSLADVQRAAAERTSARMAAPEYPPRTGRADALLAERRRAKKARSKAGK